MTTTVLTSPRDLSLGIRSYIHLVFINRFASLRAWLKAQTSLMNSCATRFLRLIAQVFSLAALVSLFAASVYAQSFGELEERLREHPRLQSLSHQADSNRALSESVMGLPDPIVSLGVNNFPIFDPSFDEFLPTNKAIGIQQVLPSWHGRKARALMAQAQAQQSTEMRSQVYSALRGELIALLHTKVLLAKQVSLAQQRDAKYDQLIEAVESEVDAGRPSVYRLAEIEARRADVSRTLVDLAAQNTQVESRLIYLVGIVPDTTPPQVAPDKWSGELADFNASRIANALVKLRDGGIDEAKAAWRPEWGLQLRYHQREAGRNFDGDDWVSAMVTFSVPFWAKDKQVPRLRAAKAAKQAALATLTEAKRQATAQYSTFKANYLAAKDNTAVLERKISAINKEILAQQSNYESGAGFYAPIIDGEIVILMLRAEIAAQEARSEIASAQMNALMVTP
jgi:outer membrane protein TolC